MEKQASKNKSKSDREYKDLLADHVRLAKEKRAELLAGSMTLGFYEVLNLKDAIEYHDKQVKRFERTLLKRELK